MSVNDADMFAGLDEVRPHVPGQRTLRGLNQPSRVAHQPDLVCRPAARVQHVEKALNLLQALRRLLIDRDCARSVPDPQAQMLELTQDEHRVEALRVDEAAVSARPASAVPVVTRAKDQLHRVEPTRVAVLTRRLEPIGQMGRVQLPLQTGRCREIVGDSKKQALKMSAIDSRSPFCGVRLSPCAEQLALERRRRSPGGRQGTAPGARCGRRRGTPFN